MVTSGFSFLNSASTVGSQRVALVLCLFALLTSACGPINTVIQKAREVAVALYWCLKDGGLCFLPGSLLSQPWLRSCFCEAVRVCAVAAAAPLCEIQCMSYCCITQRVRGKSRAIVDEIRSVGGGPCRLEMVRWLIQPDEKAFCFWGSISVGRNLHCVPSTAGQRSPTKRGLGQGGCFSTQCVRMSPLIRSRQSLDLVFCGWLICLFTTRFFFFSMNTAFNSATGLEGQRVVGDKNDTGY